MACLVGCDLPFVFAMVDAVAKQPGPGGNLVAGDLRIAGGGDRYAGSGDHHDPPGGDVVLECFDEGGVAHGWVS